MSVPLKTSQASLTLMAASLSLKSSPVARLRLRRALSRALVSSHGPHLVDAPGSPGAASATGGAGATSTGSAGGPSGTRTLYTSANTGPSLAGSTGSGASGLGGPGPASHQFFDPSLTLVGALEGGYAPKDAPQQHHPLFSPSPAGPRSPPQPQNGSGGRQTPSPSNDASSSSSSSNGPGSARNSDTTLTSTTSTEVSDHPPSPVPTSSNPSSSSTSTSSSGHLASPLPKVPPHPSQLPSFFRPPQTSFTSSQQTNGGGSFVFRNGAYGIPKARHSEGSDGGGSGNGSKSAKRKGKGRLDDGSVGAAGSAAASNLSSATLTDSSETLSVQVGEDAYFLRSDSLGVADGVGGWRSHPGANPALFSRKLMHHCSHELARYEDVDDPRFLSYHDVDPIEVLQRAYDRCLQEAREEGVVGSSTALLAVLRNDELRIANMGDCCCSIIRGTDYIFRSEEQQHSFNYPVQAGTNSKDTPEKDGQRFTVKVQKNDIVILSSDGLVDNLFDEDILEEVLRFTDAQPEPYHETSFAASSFRAASSSFASAFSSLSSPSSSPSSSDPDSTPPSTPEHSEPAPPKLTLDRFSPQAVSEALCSRAKAVSEDQRAVTSPFAQRAMEEGIHFVGGKNDDISVLVAVVGDQEDSPDRR